MLTGRVSLVPFVAAKLASTAKHYLLVKLLTGLSAKQPDHFLASLAVEDFLKGTSHAFDVLNKNLGSTSQEALKEVVSPKIWETINTAELIEMSMTSKELKFINVAAYIVNGGIPEMFRHPPFDESASQEVDAPEPGEYVCPEFPRDKTVSLTVRFFSEVFNGDNSQLLHRRIDDIGFSTRIDTESPEWKITAMS